MPTLTLTTYNLMRRELASLRAMAAITGEDLRALIDVPPATRATLLDFAAQYPTDAHVITRELAYRDEMLDLYNRQEAA